jgi:hypothetical protein
VQQHESQHTQQAQPVILLYKLVMYPHTYT